MYKCIGCLIATLFISGLQAQKYDKKYNETFKVDKDVVLAINASNADINVTTWGKNEVSVEATITVDGLSKKEAKKFLENWKFEALGNRSKVQVNANTNHFLHFNDNDFVIDLQDIEIPEIHFENIEIEIPEFEMPEIEIPEIHLDFDEIWEEIDEYDFDSDANDGVKTFTYEVKGKKKKVVIKSEKEWQKFKKSKDYKDFKKDLKKKIQNATDKIKNIDVKKIQQQIKKAKQIENAKIRVHAKKEQKAKQIENAKIRVRIKKEQMAEQIRKAKIRYQKIDKEKMREHLAKAKASIEKMRLKMGDRYKNGENVIVIEDGNSKKKVKITRKITIKVPKNAKFDLNTRHSKVNLPRGKVSGKVSYGTFKADEILGGDLDIYSSPVNVEKLIKSTVSLNNITDATIASVMDTKLTSKSSNLIIDKLENNVNLTVSFGELVVSEVISNLQNFKLNLNFGEASVNFKNLKEKLRVVKASKIKGKDISKNFSVNGNFGFKNASVDIEGKQSELSIVKE